MHIVDAKEVCVHKTWFAYAYRLGGVGWGGVLWGGWVGGVTPQRMLTLPRLDDEDELKYDMKHYYAKYFFHKSMTKNDPTEYRKVVIDLLV